jgi:hypothetical protein
LQRPDDDRDIILADRGAVANRYVMGKFKVGRFGRADGIGLVYLRVTRDDAISLPDNDAIRFADVVGMFKVD